MSLFPVNSQQWFNTDCIETIDDYGYDIGVKLKGGREMRIHGNKRDAFFAAVVDMLISDEPSSSEQTALAVSIVEMTNAALKDS